MKTNLQITLEELGRYSIPILTIGKRKKSPFLVGTGTLYCSGSDVFLITAKHVIDDLEGGSIVTGGKNGFIRFSADKAAFEYSKGNGRDHDICIIRISTNVIQNLHSFYRFVADKDMSVVQTYDRLILYAFVGYPHSKNKPKPNSMVNMITLKPFYYAVNEFIDINDLAAAVDKSNELHVAFKAPFIEFKDINSLVPMTPPKPKGVSGCGVWMVVLDKYTGIVSQCALVAVGIEYLEQENAFLATRISSPVTAIKLFRDYLAGETS